MYIANFPNTGYVGNECQEEQLYSIKKEIETIQSNFELAEATDHTFTSTVKKEYVLHTCLEELESLVLPLVDVYYNYFEITDQPKNSKPYLNSAWVNFQEAGEFFSPHTHQGEFSFALYIKVPFFIEDEQNFLSTQEKQVKTATGFVFYYTDALGNIQPSYLPVDKTWENTIILFPGKMLHSVQPFFTSKEYRITISGNIRFKDD